MLVSMLMAVSGVAVSDKTQLPVVSGYAKCVTTKLGTVPVALDARQIGLHIATLSCRAMSTSSYTEGKLLMNGKPFPQSWWKQVVKLIDAADVELAKQVLAVSGSGKAFDALWELPDGKLVAIGEQFVPGTIRVRIVTI
jgi:hypothetical protein